MSKNSLISNSTHPSRILTIFHFRQVKQIVMFVIRPWFRREPELRDMFAEQSQRFRHELDIHQQAIAELTQASRDVAAELTMVNKYLKDIWSWQADVQTSLHNFGESFEEIWSHRRDLERRLESFNAIDPDHIRDLLLPYLHQLQELQKCVFEITSTRGMHSMRSNSTEAA